MKKQEILHIIREFSESLSLTNNKIPITETALDSLSETLGVDCSWIHLASPVSKDLYLASFRNFTDEIHNEMAHMYINDDFAREIVGFGNKVIISQINTGDSFGMEVFKTAGFSSLIAVPIFTHKVLGIIGAAYRERKKFDDDFSQMFSVIASLVGMALYKHMLTEHIPLSEDTQRTSSLPAINDEDRDIEEYAPLFYKNAVTDNNNNHRDDWKATFEDHVDRMITFHHSHK